jgi:hypothetical protein
MKGRSLLGAAAGDAAYKTAGATDPIGAAAAQDQA